MTCLSYCRSTASEDPILSAASNDKDMVDRPTLDKMKNPIQFLRNYVPISALLYKQQQASGTHRRLLRIFLNVFMIDSLLVSSRSFTKVLAPRPMHTATSFSISQRAYFSVTSSAMMSWSKTLPRSFALFQGQGFAT